MKKCLVATVVAALLPMTGQAKDFCLTDADGLLFAKFEKVKKLKPGGIVPLYGVAVFGSTGAPLAGVAVVASDGSVNYGFTVYAGGAIGVNFSINVFAADALLAGTGAFVLDEGLGAGPISVIAADCKDLPSF